MEGRQPGVDAEEQSARLQLEDAVLTPATVTDIAKIPQALVLWDAAHRDYKNAGGTALTPDRQVGAIMRLLPGHVRDEALWDFESFKDSPAKLRQWLKETAKIFSQGSYAARRPARGLNAVEDEATALTTEDLQNLSQLDDGELCAFFRRRVGPKPGGERPKRDERAPPRREAPPRDAGDARCSNCGAVGHTGRECPKPRVESKDRACFKCGQPGHQARQCPNEPLQKAKALVEAAAGTPLQTTLCLSEAKPARAQAPTFIGCFGSEDFIPIHRRAGKPGTSVPTVATARRPTPRGCTLGECMGKAFKQLREAEAHE